MNEDRNNKARKSDLSIMRPGRAAPDGVARRTISEIHREEFEGIDMEPFAEPIKCIESRRDKLLFITGGAGTGKSTLVRYIQYYFAHVNKGTIATATVAPTGVAARAAHGETIHSFFRFPPKPADSFIDDIGKSVGVRRNDSLIEKLDVLIIDEISMVRADMFDAIEKSLRVNRGVDEPFGGVNVVLVGDMLQLPPIVKRHEKNAFVPGNRYQSEFFIGARYFEDSDRRQVSKILLKKVFRQEHGSIFVECLNNIRLGQNLPSALGILNQRHLPRPPGKNILALVPTKGQAAAINSERLTDLPGGETVYEGKFYGAANTPEADDDSMPAPLRLGLKIGAQVMIVKNDTQRRRWVNGTLAKISALNSDSVEVETDDGHKWDVQKTKWSKYRLAYDNESGRIVCEEVWSYEQIPMILGWAATIHKCQGATLDRAIVDMKSGAFAEGQTYVALSRCRSMEGLYLANPLREADIHVHQDARKWYLREMSAE